MIINKSNEQTIQVFIDVFNVTIDSKLKIHNKDDVTILENHNTFFGPFLYKLEFFHYLAILKNAYCNCSTNYYITMI